MKLIFICHSFTEDSLEDFLESVQDQLNENWLLYLVTNKILKDLDDNRIKTYPYEGLTKLQAVVSCAKIFSDDKKAIIAIINGSSSLCNERTVSSVLNEYTSNKNLECLWTGNCLQVSGDNLSRPLPKEPPVNPYQFPYVSHGLKTWRAPVLTKIS